MVDMFTVPLRIFVIYFDSFTVSNGLNLIIYSKFIPT